MQKNLCNQAVRKVSWWKTRHHWNGNLLLASCVTTQDSLSWKPGRRKKSSPADLSRRNHRRNKKSEEAIFTPVHCVEGVIKSEINLQTIHLNSLGKSSCKKNLSTLLDLVYKQAKGYSAIPQKYFSPNLSFSLGERVFVPGDEWKKKHLEILFKCSANFLALPDTTELLNIRGEWTVDFK